MKKTATRSNHFERIKLEPGIEDGWIFLCRNTPADEGFFPCDKEGNEVEPLEDWNDRYVCFQCGRIIKQETLEVVGNNPNLKPLRS